MVKSKTKSRKKSAKVEQKLLPLPKEIINEVVKDQKQRNFLLRTWPFIAISLAHIIWGANFVVAKITLQEIPPMTLAFLRFFIAFLLIVPFYLTDQPKAKFTIPDLFRLTLIGLLMVSLNISLFYLGLIKTTASDAAILTMVIPILTALGAWWFLKEKIYTINLTGMILGLIGAVIIIGVPLLFLGFGLDWSKFTGNLLILLSSIAWVAGAIVSKEVLKKHTTLTITTFIFLVGLITFALPALEEYFKNPSWINHISYIGIVGLLYISILSSIVAYFLFEWSIEKLGVVKADLFQYIEPVVASSAAVFILNEFLRIHIIIGAIFIGIGVYLGSLGKLNLKHHHTHRR